MTVTVDTNFVVHEGNGVTTIFPYNFKIDEESTAKVSILDMNNDVVEVLSPGQYTLTGVGGESGTLIYTPALEVGRKILLARIVPYTQGLRITNEGGFYPTSLERQLDNTTFQIQQVADEVGRSIKVPPGSDPADLVSLTSDLRRVALSIDEVDTVANNIGDVGLISDNIASVTTVAGSIANVDAVGSNIADVGTVVDNLPALNTVAGSIGNVNAVGTNIADVIAVAANEVNIDAVVANETNIDTVAGSITNVNTVGGSIAAVNAVSANKSNIDTVAGSVADITTVAGLTVEIAALPGQVTAAQTAAGDAADSANAASISAGNADDSAQLAQSVLADMVGGTVGQILVKNSNTNYDYAWQTPTSGGDMTRAMYDPNSIDDDAFSMGNMVETSTAKILTNVERTAITDNTTARHSHSNKGILDGTQQSFTTTLKNKIDGIAAGAQVNTVTSVAGKTGAVTLAKGDVGLGSVDNTADSAKPVSTAQATAINAKVTKSGDSGLGAYTSSIQNLGSASGLTITVSPGTSNFKILEMNGSFTLAAPVGNGQFTVAIFLWSSIGTMTTTGWSKVNGSISPGKNHLLTITCIEAMKVLNISEAS